MRNATRILATLILLGSSLAGCSSPTAPDEAGFNPVILTLSCADLGASTPAAGNASLQTEANCQ